MQKNAHVQLDKILHNNYFIPNLFIPRLPFQITSNNSGHLNVNVCSPPTFSPRSHVSLLISLLDPLDSRLESNASNDRASGALRPVSNTQQMPPPIYTRARLLGAYNF